MAEAQKHVTLEDLKEALDSYCFESLLYGAAEKKGDHAKTLDAMVRADRAKDELMRLVAARDRQFQGVFGDFLEDSPAARAVWNAAIEAAASAVLHPAHAEMVLSLLK